MSKVWLVVGGKESGGIVSRAEKGLSSDKHAHRLSNGSWVQEEEVAGDRLCYTLLNGTGPHTGWVSLKFNGKPLLQRCEHAPRDAATESTPRKSAGNLASPSASRLNEFKAPPKALHSAPKVDVAVDDVSLKTSKKVPRDNSVQLPTDPPPVGDVEAPIYYLADCSSEPFFNVHQEDNSEEKMHAQFVQKVMTIRDGRRFAHDLCLDRQGVMLVPHRTALSNTDFYDHPEKLWEKYYAEMRALLMQATGASRVVAFAHHVRNQSLSHCRRDVQGYVGYAHNDYTPESAPRRVLDIITPIGACSQSIEQRVRDLAGPRVLEDEVEQVLQQRRFLILHAWRNISDVPIYADPLTVCDGRTFAENDYVPFHLMYKDTVGQTFGVRHASSHEWLYFSGMRKDEVMIFKCYDSKTDKGIRWGAHTAFSDPRTPAGAPQRESVEVRCVAIFDEGCEERTAEPASNLFRI